MTRCLRHAYAVYVRDDPLMSGKVPSMRKEKLASDMFKAYIIPGSQVYL